MTKTLAVFRFELAYQLRRASTLVYFLILIAICPPLLKMMANGSHLQGTDLNAPFPVMVTVVCGSMMALLIVAAVAGDAATRDADTRIDSLFYTSPIGKRAYVTGRFLGAFSISALLLIALPIGCIVATSTPWLDPERLGPFRASAFLAPYFLFALPNVFVATAVAFGLAVVTRRAMASYAGAAFLFFFAIVCGKVLPTRLGWSVAKLLDPFGFTTTQEIWLSTNAIQKNAFVLAVDGPLLANRLLWIGVGLVVLTAAYARFRFAHRGVGGGSRVSVDDGRVETIIAVPETRRVFDAATRRRQLLAVTMRSFRDLHASRVWWIVPLLALLFIQAAPELAKLEMDIPGPLTTARLADFLDGDVSILFTLFIALSAGELVWRERGARLDALAGVTPVPDWLTVTGKFLGLAMMLAATQAIFLLAGLMVRTAGTDLTLYVQILFGLQLPEYLLTAALAMIVHVLVNQKYVANALVLLSPVVIDTLRRLGVEDNLLLYGNLPKWTHSDISGFGPGLQARLWFTLYFGGWALLFALAAYLFWIRGEEHGLRQRITRAGRRLTRAAAIVAVTALAIIAGAGGFIFYNTHVLDDYRTTAETEQRRAEVERRYGRFASLPQPHVAATTLRVDFYPRRFAATIRGSHRLENRSGTRIDAIHVIPPGGVTTTVSFDRPARVALRDDDLGYRIYALDRGLEPGESLRMDFQVAIEPRPFRSYGSAPVAGNGSILIHRSGRGSSWLPLVGYQAAQELNDPALRKKYRLRKRPPYPRLGDVAVGNEQNGYEQIELETIVGTDAGQVGVAPGAMRRSWTEKGRRYVHYRTDAPISNAWTITSADYAVHRATWGSVAVEIFHHPAHTANLERMVNGARAALDYDSRNFGPYPHRQLRLVEIPSDPDSLGMTAHSGLITYAEGFSLIRPADDPRKIDFPFAVVAHEVGHQWWGHQLTPATIEGAPFLAESLAWYSGMLAVEETFGREHLQRILDMMRAQYMLPHQPRTVPLLRAVDQLDAYRIGPFAMYALREAVGPEPVNRALRTLLAKFPPGRPPYPTTLDFYAELRAATPPSSHGLLKDLFEDITFWDLRAKSLDVKPAAGGTYHVSVRIEAQKLKGDGTGAERPVPMDDLIEVALYDAAGQPFYRGRHRLRSGAQTIELTLARPPVRAAVDPDHELLDRNIQDNDAIVAGGTRR